jgi:hypothetical protein
MAGSRHTQLAKVFEGGAWPAAHAAGGAPRFLRGTAMMIYAPDAIRDALEVALEDKLDGKSIEEFYADGRGRTLPDAVGTSSGPRWSGDHWTREMPGAERELDRVLDALRHISADCPRDIWRRVVAAISDRFLGSDVGNAIARAWSLGGTVLGVTFPMPSGDYSVEDFEACWHDARWNSHFSIATAFHLAKQAGWNSSRKRWGLGRAHRPGKPPSAEAMQVRVTGLAMPRQNPNHERIAWYWHLINATRRPDLRDVAFVIAFSINIDSGICWRTLKSIANLLDWQRGPKGEGFRRVSRAVRDLALLGFIVRSPGNARGAHGRIGPSFALTPPDAMTWEAAVAAYQGAFGGPLSQSLDQPEMVATGTAHGGSKPNLAARTGTMSGGSQPNASGSDRHQKIPVQTTPSADRHRDMQVHLTVKGVAGGGVGKGCQAQARQKASTMVGNANQAPIVRHHDAVPDQLLPDDAFTDAVDAATGLTSETFWASTKKSKENAHG